MIKERFFLSEGVSVGENGDAALKGNPPVTFQRIQVRLKIFLGVTWLEKRRTADALFMITTPVIISTVPRIGLRIININPRDRQPEPKRNFPDSLPVANSGRK